MNKQQHSEYSAYFARQWLEVLLTWCRGRKGFLYRLRICGHMHGRITSCDKAAGKFSLETFLRLLVNMAMECTEKEFHEVWTKLGNMIYRFAEEHGDDFNRQYAKQPSRRV